APASAPAGTDPSIASRLRVERALPGAWLGNRQMEAAYDPVTGSVLVGAPFEAFAVHQDALHGARVVGQELRVLRAGARAASPAGYPSARAAASRSRSEPGDAAEPGRALDLERLFGANVVFPARSGRPWGAVAQVTRMAPDGDLLTLDLRAVSGRTL